MDSLGATVRKLRQERGWTQEHLAELTSTSQRWISNLEGDNVRMPRLARLHRLADAFGIDSGVLVRAAQYTNDVELGREIAESAGAADPLPAHLRTSFLKLQRMSPERRKIVEAMIDELDAAAEVERERLRRDEDS